MRDQPAPQPRRSADEDPIDRAVRTTDEVLDALARYPERDDAVEQLERRIVDERLQKLGSTRRQP